MPVGAGVASTAEDTGDGVGPDSEGVGVTTRVGFTEHDRWTVEFYQENPANSYVVVLPLQRSNDTLRRLGAPGGVKGSFPEDFYLAFNPDRAHLDAIAWNTMSGSVGALCSP